MNQFDLFLPLLGVVALIGIVFKNASAPLSLYLMIAGMLLSLFPFIPRITFNPTLVLDVFLPLLIYEMTSETSWREVKFNMRPILLLSVGHVVFITVAVAIVIHSILPELGWPLAFVLGAVVSPPDDVAIIPIIEKGYLPQRLVTILKSEAMFNDSMALILFRFALVAFLTHQFSLITASVDFLFIILAETLYGLFLGFTLGYFRVKIKEPRVQMLTSLLSPFLAYIPAVRLGGCGVLATAVMGLVISHRFFHNFAPEVRLLSRSVWAALSFAIQGLLFLLVGLDLHFILDGISTIPRNQQLLYGSSVVLTVIVGRFFWVYPITYLPRFFFASIRKRDPYPPWQYPFATSWAGMRGSISLAAVLAVPHLSLYIFGANVRDLLIYLVFCVIFATLVIQGLTLPIFLKLMGVPKYKLQEKHEEELAELSARVKLSDAVLSWLEEYKHTAKDNQNLTEEIRFYLRKYQITKKQFQQRIKEYSENHEISDGPESREGLQLACEILKIERSELSKLWHQDEISHAVRNKLLMELDHRTKQLEL